MADASTPLLADPNRPTTPSSYAGSIEVNNERPSLFRRVPSFNPHFNLNSHLPNLHLTPTLPYTTTLHPTLYLRSLSIPLLLPAFILFITANSHHYAAVITFLSFALARQLWILIAHFGSQVIVIRIEVVHARLKGVSERAQERWIKRGFGAGVDGVVLVGLLVCLGLVAGEVDKCKGGCEVQEAGVILGFLGL
ncbi:hypothetical protein B0J14DRAFT_145301 [Halenospora varia]|nr:hypothetical protein B0J14DRAFT_145301 [Halenospora varia]